MNVRKVKRKCGVRGCKNTHNVYALSKSREFGNSIIMCTDCMQKALAEIEKKESEVTISSVANKEPELVEVVETVTEEIPVSVAEDTVIHKTATNKTTRPKKK